MTRNFINGVINLIIKNNNKLLHRQSIVNFLSIDENRQNVINELEYDIQRIIDLYNQQVEIRNEMITLTKLPDDFIGSLIPEYEIKHVIYKIIEWKIWTLCNNL
jgi:hypothetical protein